MMKNGNSKPDVWVFFDLDQTVIDTYKGKNGKPYVDNNGKPYFTREVWAEVLRENGVIDSREYVRLCEPWCMLARSEITNEAAARLANKYYLEVMIGKKHSDLVAIAKNDLAPRAIIMPYVMPVYAFFKKYTDPTFGLVTNVYDEVCQGLNDSGKVIHQIRICNKPKLVDGKISGEGYEVDVSGDKQIIFTKYLTENKIPEKQTFGFEDRYPQGTWVGYCWFPYCIGSDKRLGTFVKQHHGTIVKEYPCHRSDIRSNLRKDIDTLVGRKKA